MDWTLELHGSEVQRTEVDGLHLRLRFSAALVQRPTEEGHVKGLMLDFGRALVHEGDLALCLGALSDSALWIDGVRHRHLPLPFEALGEIRAELTFRSGTTLRLSARSVRCDAPDERDVRPSYAC